MCATYYLFQAKSLEDLEERMEDFEMRISSRFDALKQFTLKKVKELEMKNDVANLKENLGSLKGEFELFKNTSFSPASSEDNRKREHPESAGNMKKSFRGFSFLPSSTSTPLRQHPVATYIEEVRDPQLKAALETYRTEEPTQRGKLSQLHYAYFLYFFAKRGGYSGRTLFF